MTSLRRFPACREVVVLLLASLLNPPNIWDPQNRATTKTRHDPRLNQKTKNPRPAPSRDEVVVLEGRLPLHEPPAALGVASQRRPGERRPTQRVAGVQRRLWLTPFSPGRIRDESIPR